MSRDKVHYFTGESFHTKPDCLWYHSGCKLAAAKQPSENISQVTCERCKAHLTKKHPRYRLQKHVGNLEMYFETGMECMGTIFHDDRGLNEGVDYADPTKKRMYHSLEWSIWFGNKMGIYKITIFDKENKVVYEGSLTKDKHKMAKEKYRYGYLPKEIETKTWLEYCTKEYRAELWTNEIISALKEKYKLEFDVGEVVEDKLTGKDVVIINWFHNANHLTEYWVSDDQFDGSRLAGDIRKINWQARWNADRAILEKAKKP